MDTKRSFSCVARILWIIRTGIGENRFIRWSRDRVRANWLFLKFEAGRHLITRFVQRSGHSGDQLGFVPFPCDGHPAIDFGIVARSGNRPGPRMQVFQHGVAHAYHRHCLGELCCDPFFGVLVHAGSLCLLERSDQSLPPKSPSAEVTNGVSRRVPPRLPHADSGLIPHDGIVV